MIRWKFQWNYVKLIKIKKKKNLQFISRIRLAENLNEIWYTNVFVIELHRNFQCSMGDSCDAIYYIQLKVNVLAKG